MATRPADTPLMRQYLDIKQEHPDSIVFFRLGDFYEMFFEDAVLAARKLDLTLTSRDKGKEDAVPMCGVPHHAARGYIARLTELGYKVVLAEQVEDPRHAKGLVKREVVRVVTPGVVLDDDVLEPKAARYLAGVVCGRGGGRAGGDAAGAAMRFGLAYVDVTTGELRATELAGAAALDDELARVAPREILVREGELEAGPLAALAPRHRGSVWTTTAPLSDDAGNALLVEALGASMTEIGLRDRALAARAAAAVLAYARATQPIGTLPVQRIDVYAPGESVVLDEAAIANLELLQTLVGGRTQGSLLSVVDETRTAPGGRLLRRWMLYPLTDVAAIRRRQDAVEHLVERPDVRARVREVLGGIHDLERLAGKATLGVATPRDLARLRDSLQRLPSLASLFPVKGVHAAPALLQLDRATLERLARVAAMLAAALVDEPPAIAKEGGFIRDGHCATVDECRRLADGGKDAILAIETRERERSGIASLKVKYNRVFGYYIEITRSHLGRVPADYVRKQTIAGGERYVTTELAELEAKVLAAQETLLDREQELFRGLVERVAAEAAAVIPAGQRVATIDACAGLAEVAHVRGYVRPLVDDGETLEIEEGRHPVIERMVPTGSFVPNDCRLDPATQQIVLVTGPNMAGKSTYMRQVAQIVLLAQMGSFVPAKRARVGVADRVFTRVGAADNLSRGESTFMVEMRETAAILAGATRRSLVVLDEVGRGTSTFDGVSIAWAVAEHLHDTTGARTLFATHYHELCALAESRPRVKNVSMAVREHKGEVVFLRQVVDGGANRSYGIDVARLAGLPRTVVTRAREMLAQLEGGSRPGATSQLPLFAAAAPAPVPSSSSSSPSPSSSSSGASPDPVLRRLRSLDPDRMTPIEALALLAELCQAARLR